MNKRQTEYIALYLFVFEAILLFGVLARKFVLVKGYDEFSAAVGFFATVVVFSALYISLQMTLNELLLPRMEKFMMRFPAFQKLEEVAVVAETTAIVVEPIEEVAVAEATPQPTEYEVLRANGHTPSEAFNETVEELSQSLMPLIAENGMDWMYANCSTTAQRGALDWWKKFRDATRPVFEELYSEVACGNEAQRSIDTNSQPDYRAKLEEELREMRETEMWQAGAVVRKLRPENN